MTLQVLLCAALLGGPFEADQYASRIEVSNGKTVALTASAADNTEWRWMNPPPDANPQVWPDGKLYVLSTGYPGEYIVAESAASIVDSKVKQRLLLHLVKVQAPVGPAPGPGPGPPPPPPGPQFDPGKYGLAEFTYRAVIGTPGIDRSLCTQLAGNFSTIATQIGFGQFADFKAANEKLKALNEKTYGTSAAAWKPATDQLGARLSQLATDAKVTPTNWKPFFQTAYEEIAIGFAAAGN